MCIAFLLIVMRLEFYGSKDVNFLSPVATRGSRLIIHKRGKNKGSFLTSVFRENRWFRGSLQVPFLKNCGDDDVCTSELDLSVTVVNLQR